MEFLRHLIRKPEPKQVELPEFGFQKNILDFNFLDQFAQANHQNYVSAHPYPHIVIDNFLALPWVQKIVSEIPSDPSVWLDYSGADARGKVVQKNKIHLSDEDKMGFYTQRLNYELKSKRFADFIESLTGMKNVLSDVFNYGGGIHMNRTGSLLKIHADFNRHPLYDFDRRLNLLIYLNEGWQESWGGHLELWDEKMTKCQQRILPVAGRAVIFNTTRTSYHGHPDPTTCPKNIVRKSLAFYYYTNTNLTTEDHSTLWQDRPEID